MCRYVFQSNSVDLHYPAVRCHQTELLLVVVDEPGRDGRFIPSSYDFCEIGRKPLVR